MKYCSSRQSAVQGETGPPRRRRALSVTSAVALSTFTLAAYGGISTAQNLPAASSGLTGSLTISEQAFTAPIIAPVISAFQKLNPNLHVTASVQGTTTTTYTTVLLTEKLAGDLPGHRQPGRCRGPRVRLRRDRPGPQPILGQVRTVPAGLLAPEHPRFLYPKPGIQEGPCLRAPQRGRRYRDRVQRQHVQKGRCATAH